MEYRGGLLAGCAIVALSATLLRGMAASTLASQLALIGMSVGIALVVLSLLVLAWGRSAPIEQHVPHADLPELPLAPGVDGDAPAALVG